eukprot:392495-Pelagomonas_calceolata.AAC.1
MLFTKQRNPQATAEYMCVPILAGCRWIRQFASEHRLTDRPHALLWLTKAYALPASISAPVLTEAYPWGKAHHS